MDNAVGEEEEVCAESTVGCLLFLEHYLVFFDLFGGVGVGIRDDVVVGLGELVENVGYSLYLTCHFHHRGRAVKRDILNQLQVFR